jgi:tRNA pseudouridine65 synthase
MQLEGDVDQRKAVSGLEIVHCDDALAVVNKPSGMLVHRGWDNDRVVAMTLLRDQIGRYVFPVHRLDRGTSGALVFALSSEVARTLSAAFEQGRVAKRYVALVRGVPPDEGTIDSPVPRSEGGARVPAVTEYRRLFVFGRFSIVEARPLTGRLHQVRRHLKHLGHPIIGDVNYGRGELNRLFRADYGLHRLALHALELQFEHPATGQPLGLAASLPGDLREPLERMGVPVASLFG